MSAATRPRIALPRVSPGISTHRLIVPIHTRASILDAVYARASLTR